MLGASYWQSLNSGIATITIPYKRARKASVQHSPSGQLAGSVGFKRRRASHAVKKEPPVPDYCTLLMTKLASFTQPDQHAARDTQEPEGVAHRYECSASADVVQELDLQRDRLTHRGA